MVSPLNFLLDRITMVFELGFPFGEIFLQSTGFPIQSMLDVLHQALLALADTVFDL